VVNGPEHVKQVEEQTYPQELGAVPLNQEPVAHVKQLLLDEPEHVKQDGSQICPHEFGAVPLNQ
jgi:hypothetical protein